VRVTNDGRKWGVFHRDVQLEEVALKRDAVLRAQTLVAQAGGGEVLIYDRSGRLRSRHRIADSK